MGVGGLWPLLEPTSSSITLDRLEGKRLAVDIHYGCTKRSRLFSHNLDSKCPHLSLLIHRISKLLFYKIRPVFIFDGAEVPVFKKQLLRNRALKKHLDELTSTKQTQMKMLERVVQEKHGELLDDLSCSSSDPPSPQKKARKSAEEDMFVLPSTSVKLLETDLDETMVSADDRMTFLKNAKEKFREARLRIEEIPEESKDFSSFQLKRSHRNKIHTQMEMLKKEKLAQCVRVSADKMKMVVVDNHLRSHVLLRDDDVQIINQKTWTGRSWSKNPLHGLNFSTDGTTAKRRTAEIWISSADYVKSGIDEDSWTSESEDSNSDANPATTPLSKADARADKNRLTIFRKQKNVRSQHFKRRDDGVYTDCQQFLTLLGLPYLCAPGEAEAQCAELERLGLVDGIISDDSDVWLLFGAKLVYKNMFSRSKHVQEYQSGKIFKELGLERKEFVQIVGVVTALELIAEFAKLDETKTDSMSEAFAMWRKFEIGSSQTNRLRRIIENNNDETVISKFPNPAFLMPMQIQ
uniref:Uncharacterized protein n=1 Tax=Ditylenchus dipsaci TaxID=166011 RepID=A0A915ED79_9BILA